MSIQTHRKMTLKQRFGARVAHVIEMWRANQVINPCSDGTPVTYPYGVRSSAYASGYHTGEDHACVEGTLVQSVSYGKVVFVGDGSHPGGWGPSYGKQVIIETVKVEQKTGKSYRYAYCHLSAVNIKVGTRVNPGAVLGRSGQTGNATGPHLHFEARVVPYTYGTDIRPSIVKMRRGNRAGNR